MRILLGLFGLAFSVAIVAAVAIGYASFQMKQPSQLTEQTYTIIEPGTSVRGIARKLQADGAIDPQASFLFPFVVRLRGVAGQLQAGEYLIVPGMSANEMMTMMVQGNTVQRQVTVPEGLTSYEVVQIVNALKAVEGEMIDTIPEEGSLLPESFAYDRSNTRQDILNRMTRDLQAVLDREWETREENLPYESKQDALIMASIIEKETGVADERRRVAGVFVNRLRRGMPLQTDPTVIYALTEGRGKLDRALLTRDLRTPHPYNTYMNAGLPPGPIANPGIASIQAALHPEAHDYIYFVADGTGGHSFAKTLDEHNANVRKWRQIRKSANP